MQMSLSPKSARYGRKSQTLSEPNLQMVSRSDVQREYSKSVHKNAKGLSIKPPRV